MSRSLSRMARPVVLFSLVAALLFMQASCGKRAAKPEKDDASYTNFTVREAITEALAKDRALDENAKNAIALVRANQSTLDKTFDDLVDQTHTLLSTISTVATTPQPNNTYLTQARDLIQEYLRNRVHQIEACLSAATVDDLETQYNRPGAELNTQRLQVRDLLLKYDPELQKFLPQ